MNVDLAEVAAQWVASDWLLVAFGLLVLVFTLDYGIFSPWWTHPIGWVVMFYSLSVALLVGLIIYGMIYGERVGEWARVPMGILLVGGILGKLVILHVSRHRGLVEARRLRSEREAAGRHYAGAAAGLHVMHRPETLIPDTSPNPIFKTSPRTSARDPQTPPPSEPGPDAGGS